MSEAMRETGGGAEPSYRERLRSLLTAAVDLLQTRAEILREEASQKAMHLARGLAGVALALVTGWIAMLLLAALLAALFTLLFGRVWLGILAALVLYGGAAAAAAFFGQRALSRVRPFDFPVTGAEIQKDWEALWSRIHAGEEEDSPAPDRPSSQASSHSPPDDDVEARFRAGSE